jgi:phage baseplate assembly protein W
MLRDIYAIPEEEPRFKENVMEINGELDEIIQQVDMILFTNKGDVLCMPEFGCNLGRYLFETTYNENIIKQIIMGQIQSFIYLDGSYNVDVDVKFVKWNLNVAMIVDLVINNKKVASYLV